MRTATFGGQNKMFWKFVAGHSKISQQRVLKFSPGYRLDTIQFEKQIEKVRKTLPASFFTTLDFLGDWLDNIPDEKAIWFMLVFAQKDSKGNYKIFSAIKITFDGTDARVDNQRRDPFITNLEFIFEESRLKQLAVKLRTSPEAMPK